MRDGLRQIEVVVGLNFVWRDVFYSVSFVFVVVYSVYPYLIGMRDLHFMLSTLAEYVGVVFFTNSNLV